MGRGAELCLAQPSYAPFSVKHMVGQNNFAKLNFLHVTILRNSIYAYPKRSLRHLFQCELAILIDVRLAGLHDNTGFLRGKVDGRSFALETWLAVPNQLPWNIYTWSYDQR